MALPPPPVAVTAEDVDAGKPDPACYNLGRDRIGITTPEQASSETEILVVEDSPSGIKAGKAAGCRVLGLATTHSIESVTAAGADWVIKDLRSMKVSGSQQGANVEIQLEDCWVPPEAPS